MQINTIVGIIALIIVFIYLMNNGFEHMDEMNPNEIAACIVFKNKAKGLIDNLRENEKVVEVSIIMNNESVKEAIKGQIEYIKDEYTNFDLDDFMAKRFVEDQLARYVSAYINNGESPC